MKKVIFITSIAYMVFLGTLAAQSPDVGSWITTNHIQGGTIINSHTTPGIEFRETDLNVTWRNVVGGDQYNVQRNGEDRFVMNAIGEIIIKNSLINNGEEDFRLVAGHANGNVVLETNGQKRMRILNNGNVLVGNITTAPPGYKMFVDQGILTEKVRVAVKNSSDWADYVFEDDYELRPLDEVDKFIKEHKHLPGVPSAEEVVAKGIDMAKMDAILLGKMEEAYLYILELNGEIKRLKKMMLESKN